MDATKTIIEQFTEATPLPTVLLRLTQLINDEESTMKDFEEVIRLDPALVTRLLNLVNSSYFGLIRKVDSIARAVALLGMKTLHNIAMTSMVRTLVQTAPGSCLVSQKQLWRHSVAVGICGKMIAERIFSLNGDDIYLCGVLHDIGLLAECQAKETAFAEVMDRWREEPANLVQIEAALLGTNHCLVGAGLAEQWHVVDPLVEAIRTHHDLDDPPIPSPRAILQLAEYVVAQLDLTIQPDVEESLPPALHDHLEANLDEYQVLAEDLPEELARMDSMYG